MLSIVYNGNNLNVLIKAAKKIYLHQSLSENVHNHASQAIPKLYIFYYRC